MTINIDPKSINMASMLINNPVMLINVRAVLFHFAISLINLDAGLINLTAGLINPTALLVTLTALSIHLMTAWMHLEPGLGHLSASLVDFDMNPKKMPSDLQTPRGRVFFWLGLAVFPLFWVGWMRRHDFTPRQILGGRLWAGLYILLLTAVWLVFPEVRNRVSDLQWMYSHVAFHVGIALWLWLIVRMTSIREIIIGFILCIDILAMMLPQMTSTFRVLTPHPASLLYVIVPAVAHLLLEPARRRFGYGPRGGR